MKFYPEKPLSELKWEQNRIDPKLQELAGQISASGFIYPIIVHSDGSVAEGRRRCGACELLKRDTIPAVVLAPGEVADPAAIDMIANTQRLALTPCDLLKQLQAEIAAFFPDDVIPAQAGIQTPAFSPATVKALAAKVNLSVDDTLKLLTFSRCAQDVQALVQAGQMPLNVAILTVNLDEKKRQTFAKYYAEQRPSYRDAKGWFRQNRAALELREAMFDTKGCKGCACCGDGNPALFDQAALPADKDSYQRDAERCFNPECWHQKEREFRAELKHRAAGLGYEKAGISTRNLYDTDSLVAASTAKPKDRALCAECKLVKFCNGHATKGKWVLYCPTSCPNLPAGRGGSRSAQGGRPQMQQISPEQKLREGKKLTEAETKQLVNDARRDPTRELAVKYVRANVAKVKDPLALLRTMVLLRIQLSTNKPEAVLRITMSDISNIIRTHLAGMRWFHCDVDLLMLVLFGTKGWTAANQKAIDAALPLEIKKLLAPDTTNVKKKEAK